MNKYLSKKRMRIYPVVWTGIILASIYLIYRFATLTFSFQIVQAEHMIKENFVNKLCEKVMEEGSGVFKYTAKVSGKENTSIALFSNHIPIQKFAREEKDKSPQAQPTQTISEDKGSTGMIYHKISGSISKEYILTNGLVYNTSLSSDMDIDAEQLIGYSPGNLDIVESEDDKDSNAVETINTSSTAKYTLAQLKDFNFLVRNFYVVDASTRVTKDLFNGEKLIGKDMKLKQTNDEPQILILHTHAHEAFIDSRTGKMEDTVVGVGTVLTDILENTYHYNVIHDTTGYDIVNGKLDRSYAYHQAKKGIEKILKQYPSIEVVIDLHRDSGAARNVTINGKESAKVMLFNGLSRDKDGPIDGLPNANLQNNLAFSLQLQLKARELFPDFFVRNYLKDYRYNLHIRPKSLLVELGTEKNTLDSAKNAMEPFAKVLDSILQGK